MKKLILLITVLSLFGCNKFFTGNAVVFGPQAAGDMPEEAMNVDSYDVILKRSIDLNAAIPDITFNGSDDTLTCWFNYREPEDNLPMVDLPSDIMYLHSFQNTDDYWDSDSDCNLQFIRTLEPGLWSVRVRAVNTEGTAMSGRYDFFIEGSVPVKLFFRGVFK